MREALRLIEQRDAEDVARVRAFGEGRAAEFDAGENRRKAAKNAALPFPPFLPDDPAEADRLIKGEIKAAWQISTAARQGCFRWTRRTLRSAAIAKRRKGK